MLSVEESNALLDSFEMWDWISKHKLRKKIGFFQTFYPDRYILFNCYLCQQKWEWSGRVTFVCDYKCLVRWVGPRNCDNELLHVRGTNYPCENEASCYEKRNKAVSKGHYTLAQMYAFRIANLHRMALGLPLEGNYDRS